MAWLPFAADPLAGVLAESTEPCCLSLRHHCVGKSETYLLSGLPRPPQARGELLGCLPGFLVAPVAPKQG